MSSHRGEICPCRHCRRQCKIFASGVNFSIFTHFLCFFLLKLLKLGEIDGVKFLAWKSGGVKFWTNSMSVCTGYPKKKSTIKFLPLSAAPCVSIIQWALERSEKDQNCKLQFPQPDYWPRHSPDFRTVFGIMIWPFSFCEIGKTWGTNKQVNKQTNKNWKYQFPQPDYQPRHSSDFRTVF